MKMEVQLVVEKVSHTVVVCRTQFVVAHAMATVAAVVVTMVAAMAVPIVPA